MIWPKEFKHKHSADVVYIWDEKQQSYLAEGRFYDKEYILEFIADFKDRTTLFEHAFHEQMKEIVNE